MAMKNSILGAVAGLFIGSIGALAYSHYVDGNVIDDLQSKLDEANSDLSNLKNEHIKMARQTSGESNAAEDLANANADLRKQLEDAKGAPPAVAPAPEVNMATLAGMMMGMMRGGGGPFQQQQHFFAMQARLKLTPDQAAKIKAAMDADQKARRGLMRQRFQNGGQVDPAAVAAANTLDKTLATVLTYQQQADYQKLQSDEKAARAETSATSQVNGVMPLLQLSDSQKEAAMQALYQVQMDSPDPQSLMGDPNPMAAITTQAQATQGVLAKVLTPDQMTLYQQEAQAQSQAMAQFGQGRRGGNRNGGNGATGANGAGGATGGADAGGATTAGTPTTPGATPAVATTAASTNAAPTTDPSAPTTNAAPSTTTDSSTNSAAATTNAAPSQ
jgi:hypothetical protein